MIIVPDIRLKFIEQKVIELNSSLGIKEYPINMLDLLQQHFSDKYLVHFADYSDKAEVVTNYYPDYDECVIIINKKYVHSDLLKRLNFSLAHEFGHIILKHYLHEDMDGLSAYYEKEADEFAGQFLMPENEITFPFTSRILSDLFFVSLTAVNVRLQKIKYRQRCERKKAEALKKTYDNDNVLRNLELSYYEP